MAQPSRRALRGIAAAALLTASPALVGCGFDPQTNQVYQPAVGTNFTSSTVDVLGAVVVAGEDGEGRVIASFNNNDLDVDDALTGISGAGDDSSLQIDFGGSIELPAGRLLNLVNEEPIIATGTLVPGSLVNLRYTFAEAEAVAFQAVVVAQVDQYAELGPDSGAIEDSEIPEIPPGENEFEFGQGGDGGSAPLETGQDNGGQGGQGGQGGEG